MDIISIDFKTNLFKFITPLDTNKIPFDTSKKEIRNFSGAKLFFLFFSLTFEHAWSVQNTPCINVWKEKPSPNFYQKEPTRNHGEVTIKLLLNFECRNQSAEKRDWMARKRHVKPILLCCKTTVFSQLPRFLWWSWIYKKRIQKTPFEIGFVATNFIFNN